MGCEIRNLDEICFTLRFCFIFEKNDVRDSERQANLI